MTKVKALVFDVYGTLLDPFSIQATATNFNSIKDAGQFVALWRAKQLEYSWLVSLMERYQNFWQLTQQALDYTAARFQVVLTPEQYQQLLDAWTQVAPYADVPAGLATLQSSGLRLAALSNGDPVMLEKGLTNAGILDRLETVMSVDTVKIFKPSPEVYKLALHWLETDDPAEIGFVSSNSWDAIGAAAFGFQVCWLNRANMPLDQMGIEPAAQVASFQEVIQFFSSL